MSDTPRTDAMRLKMAQLGWPPDGEPVAMLIASHDELERELNFERKATKQIHAANEQLEAKLAAERALADRLAAKAGDDRAEIEQIKATLANPHAVHLNMLRGTIQWTPANLKHLLGDTDQ